METAGSLWVSVYFIKSMSDLILTENARSQNFFLNDEWKDFEGLEEKTFKKISSLILSTLPLMWLFSFVEN